MAMTTRTPTDHAGSVDMFLKITGNRQGVIKGESGDSKHLGEIDVESFHWDILQPYDKSGSGLATGKRVHGAFTFAMKTSVATPKLLLACATGEHLKTAVLVCRKAGLKQQEYMKWTLSDAMVVNVNTGYAVSQDVVPQDEISLVFRKIQLDYNEQKPDGSLGGAVSFLDDWNI